MDVEINTSKVILKYLNPKEGIIKIENKELKEYTQSELAEILSFVPQKSSLTMPLTVEDVVYMGRVPYMKISGQDLTGKTGKK